jgi:hypothetical protein
MQSRSGRRIPRSSWNETGPSGVRSLRDAALGRKIASEPTHTVTGSEAPNATDAIDGVALVVPAWPIVLTRDVRYADASGVACVVVCALLVGAADHVTLAHRCVAGIAVARRGIAADHHGDAAVVPTHVAQRALLDVPTRDETRADGPVAGVGTTGRVIGAAHRGDARAVGVAEVAEGAVTGLGAGRPTHPESEVAGESVAGRGISAAPWGAPIRVPGLRVGRGVPISGRGVLWWGVRRWTIALSAVHLRFGVRGWPPVCISGIGRSVADGHAGVPWRGIVATKT